MMKELVAKEIASRVQDGEYLGIGTGSTVDLALEQIGRRIKEEKLVLHAVTTSYQSAMRCEQYGITVLDPLSLSRDLDWGFDGADEVDHRLRVIKGRGAAMLREKIVAARCRRFVVIVDESKIVDHLGRKCMVPVELIPESLSVVERELRKLGAREMMLRDALPGKHGPVITERGNLVLDVRFDDIGDDFEFRVKSIVGIVESGLFIGRTDEVLVAGPHGVQSMGRTDS